MKKTICLLFTAIILTGCSAVSEKEQAEYAKSLEQAKTILKSNKAVEKYEVYYDQESHKAWAQSNIDAKWAYTSDKTTKEHAMDTAIKLCHKSLLKKYDEITDSVSCEIVNVDNQWVTK